MRAFFPAVHRPGPNDSPAKCTTVSIPSSAAASISPSVGAHWKSERPPLPNVHTSFLAQCARNALPKNPLAPVIRIRMKNWHPRQDLNLRRSV